MLEFLPSGLKLFLQPVGLGLQTLQLLLRLSAVEVGQIELPPEFPDPDNADVSPCLAVLSSSQGSDGPEAGLCGSMTGDNDA